MTIMEDLQDLRLVCEQAWSPYDHETSLIGSMRMVCDGRTDAYDALRFELVIASKSPSIAYWECADGRTFEDVLALIDKAMFNVTKQEAP